jgi:hypothetical protein
MTQIFLSYRRADSDVIAGRIRDRLARAYGDKSVFMDIDNIPFGVDFRSHIKATLFDGDVLLAVVGPKWLGRDETGRSRLAEETDPVRLELEAALERKLPIIPVLVHGAKMPEAGELPPSLQDFAFFNAATVDAGRDFHPHLERLIRSINPLLKSSPLRRYGLWAAAAALLLVAMAGGVFLFGTASAPRVQVSKDTSIDKSSPPIVEPSEPWLVFRSLDITELRATSNDVSKKGYQLRNINGYVLDGSERYAMLWSHESKGAVRGGWDFNSTGFQKRHDELAALGFRPLFISAHESTGGIRYADVWRQGRAADWTVRREMSADELRAAVSEMAKRGLHPVHVYGYAANGRSQFIAIFERQTGESNTISIDTPASDTGKDWDSHIKQGNRPKSISGYRIGGGDYLTTLWERGRVLSTQFGVTEKNLDATVTQRKKQGLHLTYLSVYAGSGGLRHNLIWEKP